VAFYLTSEMDSYYFSLAILTSSTRGYPNNYASAAEVLPFATT